MKTMKMMESLQTKKEETLEAFQLKRFLLPNFHHTTRSMALMTSLSFIFHISTYNRPHKLSFLPHHRISRLCHTMPPFTTSTSSSSSSSSHPFPSRSPSAPSPSLLLDPSPITKVPRTRVVLVPDSRNCFKYLIASATDPTAPASHPLPCDVNTDVAFKFGVLADVQYADRGTVRGVKQVELNNGKKVFVKRRRAWRESLSKLKQILNVCDKCDTKFIVNLGDIIEGNGENNYAANVMDLLKVIKVFRQTKLPICHVIGNHCRVVSLSLLQKLLHLSKSYYSFHPTSKWTFIVLNTSDLSNSFDQSSQRKQRLRDIVENENRIPHHFHGAIAKSQLEWLQHQLQRAIRQQNHVVILSHYPIADGSARKSHVLANTTQVRQLIEAPNSPVVACLAGHDHLGKFLSCCSYPFQFSFVV